MDTVDHLGPNGQDFHRCSPRRITRQSEEDTTVLGEQLYCHPERRTSQEVTEQAGQVRTADTDTHKHTHTQTHTLTHDMLFFAFIFVSRLQRRSAVEFRLYMGTYPKTEWAGPYVGGDLGS